MSKQYTQLLKRSQKKKRNTGASSFQNQLLKRTTSKFQCKSGLQRKNNLDKTAVGVIKKIDCT